MLSVESLEVSWPRWDRSIAGQLLDQIPGRTASKTTNYAKWPERGAMPRPLFYLPDAAATPALRGVSVKKK